MDYFVNQFTNPAFVHKLLQFFLIASVLVFFFGLALVWHSGIVLRFMGFMSTWISSRKFMKPAVIPHFVEPALLKRPVVLGVIVILAAAVSVVVLQGIDPDVFRRVLFEGPPKDALLDPAVAVKWFLLVGNALCVVVGLLLIFFPHLFTEVESMADKWYSLRKPTYALDKMHTQLDDWVSANPTVSGIVLMVTSLGLGFALYAQMAELAPLCQAAC